MKVEELLPKALAAFDSFLVGFRALGVPIEPGAGGSTVSPGQHLLYLRSETPAVVQLLVSATDSLSGSGELLDAEQLRLRSVSMGVGPAGFISMLWSLMGLMDVIYLIENGESDMVGRVFDGMNGERGPRSTWENMSSKMPTTPGIITSQATVLGSNTGTTSRRVPSSKTTAKKKKKRKPGRMPTAKENMKSLTSRGRGGGRSVGKRTKSGRK